MNQPLFHECPDQLARLRSVPDHFIAGMEPGMSQSMTRCHRMQPLDHIPAGEARTVAHLGLLITEVQRVKHRRDATGHQFPVQLLHRHRDRKIRGRSGRDFLLERVGVQINESGQHVGSLQVHDLQVRRKAIRQLVLRSQRGNLASFNEQGTLREGFRGRDQSGVREETAW